MKKSKTQVKVKGSAISRGKGSIEWVSHLAVCKISPIRLRMGRRKTLLKRLRLVK